MLRSKDDGKPAFSPDAQLWPFGSGTCISLTRRFYERGVKGPIFNNDMRKDTWKIQERKWALIEKSLMLILQTYDYASCRIGFTVRRLTRSSIARAQAD